MVKVTENPRLNPSEFKCNMLLFSGLNNLNNICEIINPNPNQSK